MQRVAVLMVGWLAVGAVQAEMFKCVDAGGHVTFSQVRCAEDAAPVDLKVHQPNDVEIQAAKARFDADAEAVDGINQARQMATAVAQHRLRIEELSDARDAEIERFRRLRVNNNQAGATYLNAMAGKLQAITDSYNSQIEAEQRALERTLDNQ